jgi:hypothetical protein
MKHVLAVILTSLFIQGILLSVAPAVAFAQETQVTSFVSGAVYLDANGNGMAEPNEQNLAGATVNVRAADGTIFTAATNQYGFYLVSVPQGDYAVWAVDSIGNITAEIPVALGEVNAAVALDLGVIDNSNDVELIEVVEATTMRNVMFLPLVNR